ncbi:MAG: ABC transporter ATP-binding protein [Oligosphaeraceae bacterium]
MPSAAPPIDVSHLTMAYGNRVIMEDLTFQVDRGEVFLLIGPSGCGKSTLLRHLIGLLPPASGSIRILGRDFWEMPEEEQGPFLARMGVLFQSGALWGSMTLEENLSLPLQLHTELSPEEIRQVCRCKLELVGLAGFQDYYPAQLSGGMQKRAGLARAMVLDPEILFFDEPSAGLDPVSARNLDRLIRQLRDSLGTTVVMVTHDLDSIFAVGTQAIYLDPRSRSILGRGTPRELRDNPPAPEIRDFLTGGGAGRPL